MTRTISLLAHHRRYVAAEKNGGDIITANRAEVGAWETFREVSLDDGTIALVTGNGSLIHADFEQNRLVATDPKPDLEQWVPESARMKWVPGPHGSVALQTSRGTFVVADTGDHPSMRVDARDIGEWELFSVYDHATGHPPSQRSFQSAGGLMRSGLDRDIMDLHGGWLYPAETFWSPARFFPSSHDRFRELLDGCKAHGNIAVSVVNFVGGDQWSPRYFGIDHPERVTSRLAEASAEGLANIVFVMGNEYLMSELGWDFGKINDVTRRTAALVAPWAHMVIPLTERGKSLTQRYNRERAEMYQAARRGTIDAGRPDIFIGAHELSGEGVFAADFKNLGNVATCAQTGFDADQRTIEAFVSEDSARMRERAATGHFTGRHLWIAFEHSLPKIDPRWRNSHTWEEAQRRGRWCLDAGAELDFSGGQQKP